MLRKGEKETGLEGQIRIGSEAEVECKEEAKDLIMAAQDITEEVSLTKDPQCMMTITAVIIISEEIGVVEDMVQGEEEEEITMDTPHMTEYRDHSMMSLVEEEQDSLALGLVRDEIRRDQGRLFPKNLKNPLLVSCMTMQDFL